MKKSSLVVVGSGIKFVSHLTTEAIAHIEQSDKVLYLVNEPAIKDWIHTINSQSESLEDIYSQYDLRLHSYQAITNYILQTLRTNKQVCVVLYGHPTVYANPALDAVLQARKEGFYAKILPGISAEDCLFADLLIDPGSIGCHSFEATDFLIHRRQFDSSGHLILWQASIIGALDHPKEHDNTNGSNILIHYLSKFYAMNHPVFLYSAAQYPGFEPSIEKIELGFLSKTKISRITTLYIPPTHKAIPDQGMLQALGISINHLK